MTTLRWFLANRKKDDEVDVNRWRRQLHAALDAKYAPAGFTVEIVTGKEDWDNRFEKYIEEGRNQWTAWAHSVATDRIMTGQYRYTGIILPLAVSADAPTTDNCRLPRATAEMFHAAMTERPVGDGSPTGSECYVYGAEFGDGDITMHKVTQYRQALPRHGRKQPNYFCWGFLDFEEG